MGIVYTRNNPEGLIDLIKYEPFEGCELLEVDDNSDWYNGLLNGKYKVVNGELVINETDEQDRVF